MAIRTFLPEDEEAYHREHDPTGMFRPLGDELWTRFVSDLVARYATVYGALDFSIDWDDGRPNAWTEARTGAARAPVVIYGGMARNTVIGMNGLAIVIAHEVSHHLDAVEKLPDGLACESCADYLATAVVLPDVWPGSAPAMASDGISRLKRYWDMGPDTSLRSASGCGYPPNALRVQLLQQGADGQRNERCVRPPVAILRSDCDRE